ncbi:MAG: hypothetical protein MK132_17400 [Lentisphaerales bacterium]|nr:hypothetical protein [Lentisphaerales bacterium]
MSERTEEFEEIREIADAISDQEADQKQLARLQVLLENNDRAQRFYLEYMDLNASLMNTDDELNMTIRRLQYEEISIGKNPPMPPPIGPLAGQGPVMMLEGPQKKNTWPYIVIILLIIALLLLYFFSTQKAYALTFTEAKGVTDSMGEVVNDGDVTNGEIFKIEGSCEWDFHQLQYNLSAQK